MTKRPAVAEREETPGGRHSKRTPGIGSLAEADQLLDVRERLVHAIDELEASEAGIDACRALLEGLLEDFDHAANA
jgi:hypothetical protein